MGEKYRLLSVCIWVNVVHGKNSETPPHAVVLAAHEYKHTPAFVWDFEFLHPHCPGACGGVNFFYWCVFYFFFFFIFFFYSVHTIVVHCARVCVYGCMQVTSVPSEVLLILHSKGSHEQSSSACQHGASLTFGVLLKVLMEGTLRGLCPLQPSCGSVSSLLTACSLSLKTACVCATAGLGHWHLDGSPGLVCCVEVLY